MLLIGRGLDSGAGLGPSATAKTDEIGDPMNRIMLAMATMTSALAVIVSPPAHADDSQDAQFIAELADHHFVAAHDVPQAVFESAQIKAAQTICGMFAQGMTRADILTEITTDNPGPTAKQEVTIVMNAAVDVYCPQYK
jgi:hypothetical protein